jgi:hypothetical protein
VASWGGKIRAARRAIPDAAARPAAIRGEDIDRFAITALFLSLALLLAAGFPGAARAGEIQLDRLRPKR